MDDNTLARNEPAEGPDLSSRERQILDMAARGHTDQAIAHDLGISTATVATYWLRIRSKLGPTNRTELVALHLRSKAHRVIAELRQQNAQILSELDQHHQTVEMLRTSLELFQGLVETAPDAIILVDENGTIQLVNERADSLFGYEEGELKGQRIERLVPERYHSRHVVHRDEYTENPVRRPMGEHLITVARRKDGSEFRMTTALSASRSAKGLFVTCIVREVVA